MNRASSAAAVALLLACPGAWALQVVATTPTSNASNQPGAASIGVEFDRALDPASVSAASVRVFGHQRGPLPASSVVLSDGNRRLTITPPRAFFPGELVSVNLGNTLRGANGSSLRAAGYAFQYTVRAGAAPMRFTPIDTVSVRTTGAATRLYGGSFADLNRDDWVDYIAINEVSADLRVMLNRADGSGRLGPVLTPPPAIGREASPSEVGDYDNDGLIDIVTSNTDSNSVSIARGLGNGRFVVAPEVPVAIRPHGNAVLDIDGDADWDLVVATEQGNTLTILRNDGSGGFGNRVDRDSGGNGEYALASGDMNTDGIMDLVVGTRNDNRVIVLLGNGDGSFTNATNVAGGGLLWKLVLGDVDGDRDLDVASVNGQSNNGAILLGNGAGALGTATLHPFQGQMVATDLGDLDGDGDLDWVTSSFGASRWYLLRNDGTGLFTQVGQIAAPRNASCASLYDFDNDGDLDMVLADEIDDVVLLMRNGPEMFLDGFEPL